MMLGRSNKRQEFYVIRIGYIGMDSPRKFDDQGINNESIQGISSRELSNKSVVR